MSRMVIAAGRSGAWCLAGAVCWILMSTGLGAQAAGAQGDVQADATLGVAFANTGTTFQASGVGRVILSEVVSIAGEVGWLPHAAFEDADEIRVPLQLVPQGAEPHVNAYHANGNVELSALVANRVIPYATVGAGVFIAETVATGELGDTEVRARRQATNFATNLGGGITYMLTPRVGVNADYRLFYVNSEADTVRVQRLVVGVNIPLR